MRRPATSSPAVPNWPGGNRFWVGLLLLLILMAGPLGGQGPEQRQRYDLPAGDAAEMLRRVAGTSARQILYLVDAVRGVSTPPVSGDYSVREVLERLLAGTPLVITEDTATEALLVSRRESRPPRPGAIVGRIHHPATGELIRNVRVQVTGGGPATSSGAAGEYRLEPVPAGPATLLVSYTGYRAATVAVEVPAGGTLVRNFDLVDSLEPGPAGLGDPIRLPALVVSSGRKGTAKAIMEQRSAVTILDAVASDAFGDNPEGNLGEFMKHLPGVELEIFFGEVRTVRLSGLPSDYTAVTLDGMPLASVDAGTGGATTSRAFTMEMASLNSVEAIEMNRIVSADADAGAPAGTINLRTKRAFDRSGRRVSWQANATAHSEAFQLRRSLGPDEDRARRKVRPGGILEYSDVFLDRRLGVVLNLSESNVYQEAVVANFGYSTPGGGADPRPLVPASLAFQWAPRFNRRFSVTMAADARIGPRVEVGLGIIHNWADLWNPQRNVTFNPGARASVEGADPLLSFSSSSGGSVQVNPLEVAKLGATTTLLPRFAFQAGSWEVEAKGSYSDSCSWYDPLGRRGSIRDFNGPTAGNVSFRAARSSPLRADWTIVQTGGPDLGSGASYSSPAFTANDGRFGRSNVIAGEVAATRRGEWGGFAATWKLGMKSRQQRQTFEDDSLAWRTDYVGQPAVGGWAGYASPWAFDLGMAGGGIRSLGGGGVFLPNARALGLLYRDSPRLFRQNWGSGAVNYYESYIARRRRVQERVDAGYLMGTLEGRHWVGRLGLRWEGTGLTTSEPEVRPPSEVRAAGFPVNASGIATTVPGLEYQYLSRPRVSRSGSYANLFPSASVKVPLPAGAEAQLGIGRTIRRPPFPSLAGAWVVNEQDLSVTAPNPRLKPETATNLAARLAAYFEPVGRFALTATQVELGRPLVTSRIRAADFGYAGGDEFARYDFITTENGGGSLRVRSLALDYSQGLGFLGRAFQPLTIRANYTRLTASAPRASLTPHLAGAGLGCSVAGLTAHLDWNWTADASRNVAGTLYRRHHANVDAGLGWRLTRHYTLQVAARNLLNAPWLDLQRFENGWSALARYEVTGTSWTFAIKGSH